MVLLSLADLGLAGDMVQLVEHLSNMHRMLGSISSTTLIRHGGAHFIISAFGRWEPDNEKFKVILSYIARSRPDQPT